MELRPGAVEPAYFTVTTDEPLTTAPGVEWDEDGIVIPGVWADPVTVRPRRFSVDVAHPTATPGHGARVMPVGVHSADLHVTDGVRVYVRPAPDTLHVKPDLTPTA